MKTRMISAVMAAFMLATASVGITASAAETTEATAETVVEETTETTADTAEDESSAAQPATDTSSVSDDESDDMEKFREVMSELAETGTTDVAPDYDGDPYYDTDGNATLIKSEQIIYNTEEMQFIAVTTKDGHVFYVLINYTAKNGEDNVYFLNKVDDYDLYALLYAGSEDDEDSSNITPEQAAQAAEDANGRVKPKSDTDKTKTTETAESAEDGSEGDEETAPAKSANKGSIYLVVGVLALIGVGAAGFMLMKKKPQGKTAVSNETYEEEEETYIKEEDEDDFNFFDNNQDE